MPFRPGWISCCVPAVWAGPLRPWGGGGGEGPSRGGGLGGPPGDARPRLVGPPRATAGTDCLDMVTLLLRFADYVKQNSRVCSEITGFTVGYALDAQSEPTQLVPTLYVTTDKGAYYWNAVTGDIRPEQAEG